MIEQNDLKGYCLGTWSCNQMKCDKSIGESVNYFVGIFLFVAAAKGKNRCPLCHANFFRNTDSWKSHLMEKCKNNPRLLRPA